MASLVKQLDELVAANEDKKMAAVVNFIDVAEDEVTKFAEANKITKVALVVVDEKNAGRFEISEDAELTAMHYLGKKVAANVAVAPGKLDDKTIKAIVDGTSAILAAEEESGEKKDKKKKGKDKAKKGKKQKEKAAAK